MPYFCRLRGFRRATGKNKAEALLFTVVLNVELYNAKGLPDHARQLTLNLLEVVDEEDTLAGFSRTVAACVIACVAALAMGKTMLTKAVIEGLGAHPEAVSCAGKLLRAEREEVTASEDVGEVEHQEARLALLQSELDRAKRRVNGGRLGRRTRRGNRSASLSESGEVADETQQKQTSTLPQRSSSRKTKAS